MRAFLVRLAVLAVGCAVSSRAVTIEYVATDVTDVTRGEDLWRYDYIVAGHPFVASEFFDIYFDPLLYGTVQALPGPNSDWNARILQQPTPGNFPPFDVGMFDAVALAGNASLADAFSVNFVYLGSGVPGSQRFDLFGANSNVLESGFTTPPVSSIPEPCTILLAALGLAVCGRKSHSAPGARR